MCIRFVRCVSLFEGTHLSGSLRTAMYGPYEIYASLCHVRWKNQRKRERKRDSTGEDECFKFIYMLQEPQIKEQLITILFLSFIRLVSPDVFLRSSPSLGPIINYFFI
eukprot:gene9787-6864_t